MVQEIGTGVVIGVLLVYLAKLTFRLVAGHAVLKVTLVISGATAFVIATLGRMDVLDSKGAGYLGLVMLALALGSAAWLCVACMQSQSNKIQ